MKETFVLLVALFLLSPLIVFIRFATDKVKKSAKEWIERHFPSWLTGKERGD